MDLYRIIDALLVERNRLDRLIRSLEAIGPPRPAERGKKTELRGRPARRAMDPAGRSDVSERMKRYWAKRRGAVTPPES